LLGFSFGSLSTLVYQLLPFSVYLGWITIASIANVTVTLVSVEWDGFGISQETWAFLVVIIALLITLLVVATRKDLAYGLVVVWALLGIAVKHAVKQSGNQNIVTTTEISAVVIVIALALSILIPRLRR